MKKHHSDEGTESFCLSRNSCCSLCLARSSKSSTLFLFPDFCFIAQPETSLVSYGAFWPPGGRRCPSLLLFTPFAQLLSVPQGTNRQGCTSVREAEGGRTPYSLIGSLLQIQRPGQRWQPGAKPRSPKRLAGAQWLEPSLLPRRSMLGGSWTQPKEDLSADSSPWGTGVLIGVFTIPPKPCSPTPSSSMHPWYFPFRPAPCQCYVHFRPGEVRTEVRFAETKV